MSDMPLNDERWWQICRDLLSDYADTLDTEQFDQWPDWFDPTGCRYEIRSAENEALGLPAAIMYCDTHGMIVDRVTMLKKALTYRKMYQRHFIANLRIVSCSQKQASLRANYQLMQTDNDGVTKLFSVGQYRARVVLVNDQVKFAEMIVIADTFGVDNMLAVPL
ncbi:MAG: nuclear transport factor 2 family protein [Burkholderiaceae bacterium]